MAQLFAGLFKAKWDEASSDSDSESNHSDSEAESEASHPEDFATPLPGLQTTTNSERAAGPSGKTGEFETVATAAVEFIINVPESHKDGLKINVPGPHGVIEVAPPAGAEPGKKVNLRLSPPADLRVTVPPEVSAGQTMFFEASDKAGSKIAAKVPEGLKPGDVFEITPPAVMVRIPKGASTGDSVVFQVKKKWCRATIPDTTLAGHFAARLPKPKRQERKLPSSPMGGA